MAEGRPAASPSAAEPLEHGRSLTVLISGASGLIGTELKRQLAENGHTVLSLVRRRPRTGNEVNWAPSAHTIDFSVMERVDAVVNLSGSPLGRLPWTKGYRRQILESRVQATKTLAEAMSAVARPPRVFLSASGIGYYGDRPGVRLTEDSPKGDGFLADVVEAWERAAHLAPEATRVVTLRSGIVIGKGGVLSPLVPLTKLGLGARFGTGGQHWPWISLADEARAIRHLLTSSISGPVNLVGPTPATSDRITRLVAARLHRWYNFVIPERVLTIALQDAARDLLLTSQLAVPAKLLSDGFEFVHERVDQAIDAQLRRSGG
ncbi:TIGR01777 family oxidoreductase [Lysobacter korlensis]|uniref:TIGR01777 family oxidoreductase n=1 Tax=Lysobacter korlensis TaxID=553636 RepID=A0ABV6S222_9GAMM